MPNLQHIVYLTEAEYLVLSTVGTLTKNGRTITFSDNDLYITPETGESGGSGGGSSETPGVLSHSLIFGANGAYVFDGSQDVIVPVYMGTTV